MGSSPPWRVGSSLALRHKKATPPEPSLRYNQGIDCKSQASFPVPLFLASAQQRTRCLQRPGTFCFGLRINTDGVLAVCRCTADRLCARKAVWRLGSAKIGVALE